MVVNECEREMGIRGIASVIRQDEGIDLKTDFEGDGEEGWWWV